MESLVERNGNLLPDDYQASGSAKPPTHMYVTHIEWNSFNVFQKPSRKTYNNRWENVLWSIQQESWLLALKLL